MNWVSVSVRKHRWESNIDSLSQSNKFAEQQHWVDFRTQSLVSWRWLALGEIVAHLADSSQESPWAADENDVICTDILSQTSIEVTKLFTSLLTLPPSPLLPSPLSLVPSPPSCLSFPLPLLQMSLAERAVNECPEQLTLKLWHFLFWSSYSVSSMHGFWWHWAPCLSAMGQGGMPELLEEQELQRIPQERW